MFIFYLLCSIVAMYLIISKIVYLFFFSAIRFEKYNYFLVYTLSVLIFPLALLQQVSMLRYINFLSFLVVGYVIIVSVSQCFSYHNALFPDGKETMNFFIINSFKDFFSNYGLIVFAFNCFSNFYGVANNVDKPSPRRLRKIFRRTVLILYFLMALFGLGAYYSLGGEAINVEMFIFRPKPNDWQSDLLMQIGQISYLIVLFNSIVLYTNPMKIMLLNFMGFKVTQHKQNLLFTVLQILLVSIISTSFSNIVVFLNFVGGLLGTMFVFVFPGLMASKLKVNGEGMRHWFLVSWVIVVTCLGFISGIWSFIDIMLYN